MPVISEFFGIIIRMYYRDHSPPHFHAEYQGQRATFRLDGRADGTGTALGGGSDDPHRSPGVNIVGNLPCVTAASYGGGYRIHLRFDDGVEKTVDFRCWLQGPVFEPLLDEAAFRQFRIEGGTIAWASGADIAPEALHAAPSSEEAA